LRILVIIYEYPPVGGGGGKAAEEVCRYLARRGHQLRVITSHAGGLPRAEVQDGVEVLRIPCRRKERYRADLVSMALFVLRGIAGGRSLARSWRPDVLHTHFAVPSGPLALALSRLTGAPYVLTVHLGDVPGGVPEKTGGWFRWAKPLTPPLWRGAARVTAVSEYTRQLALAHYPVEIRVIPNAIDTAALDPGEVHPHDPPGVMFAGRFQPQKNPLLIVRTLAQVADLPWHCTLLGDGPLRPQIETEITRLGLERRIACPGWVRPEEVIAHFQRGDVLFMPSRAEGLPVVGLQALATGLAVVASRVGGFADLVEEGENGYLLEPDDSVGFARALRRLLDDPARLLEFRRRSRELARRFDITEVGKAYEQVLAEASDKPFGSVE
jgi:glycosyltransferase involved in cell wall biosynthesis